ncbi:MAG: lysophospholipid acyltransferase family protein [Cytophagales bacterium]|nr:lysophospholipid acyltransferase family protein [Cytophagales bacterium]
MFFLKLIGHLPLFVSYRIATLSKWLLYFVFSYRKKVIVNNIKNSFPELSTSQVNALTIKFYGYFTDLMVEFFRGSAISKKEMLDRVSLVNEQIITNYLDKGIPVVLVAGHQGNWEWAVHRLALSENLYDIVYQKLSSTLFNDFTFWVRSRFGSNVLMEKRESVILARDRKNIPRAICLAADQSPSKPESAYWTNFLNQPTGFFTGMERFAREYEYPVIFVELIRIKRGYYTMSFEELIQPSYVNVEKGAIIELFARRLEKSVLKYPDQYLWSHKRWKHEKPENATMKW